MSLDLMVVMPVYNEEECIADVVRSWRTHLDGLAIGYQILVLNDGSKDGTEETLYAFANDSNVRVINKTNSGHGPTILQGYRIAVEEAKWVFQCDSDDEMKPDHFPRLWEKRDKYDALFGIRQGREQNLARKILSGGSRITVKMLFGRSVRDVNVPYRLMRSAVLKRIVRAIPDDAFAPNVIISGAIAKERLRAWNTLVPHENRKTGAVSIMRWKLWKAALKSFRQTLTFKMPKA